MSFKVGDTVLINTDLDIVSYQSNEIGWDDEMKDTLGKYGIIIKIHSKGNYQVKFSYDADWCYYKKDLININQIRLEKLNEI
jgi:hypothetical protein